MTKSSIQTAPTAANPAIQGATPVNGEPYEANGDSGHDTGSRRKRPGVIHRYLLAAASLRLTVFLFALSLFLIFVGTLAQMDAGIGTVVKEYFRSLYVWVPLQLFVRFGQVFFGVPHLTQVPGSFPFPGGWLIGGLLLVNLLAAHAVRFRLSWKRSGILILHAGILVMMAGELLTGLFAVEGQMTIVGGGVSNVIKHHDAAELAVTGPLDGAADQTTVVSGSRLRKGGVIADDRLPFDVRVDEYLPNSRLAASGRGAANRATAGAGLIAVAEPAPEGAGVDSEQRIDLPSAYVTLTKKGTGEPLGTYLVSDWLSEIIEWPEQKVTVDGKAYGLALRFKREFTPYTFQLEKFTHDKYPGTDIPNNFSSDVRILDPERNVDREVNIHMNVPLRYQRTSDAPWWQLLVRGQETYYQQGFLPGDVGTVLQVVRNPGWLAPYFACAMVALGMVVHFTITLSNFLGKRRRFSGRVGPDSWPIRTLFAVDGLAAAGVAALYMTGFYLQAALGFLAVYGLFLVLLFRVARGGGYGESSDGFARYFPGLVLATATAVALAAALPPRDPDGKARLAELATIPVQAEGRIKPLDTVARTVLMSISGQSTFRNEKKEERPAIEWLVDVMTSQFNDNRRKTLPQEYAVFRIENDQLLTLLELPRREGLRYAPQEFAKKVTKVIEEAEKADAVPEKDRNPYQVHVIELAQKVQTYLTVARLMSPRMVPPEDPRPNADWLTLPEAAAELKEGKEDPAAVALLATLEAYSQDDAAKFNKSLAKYQELVSAKVPDQAEKADFEAFFNHFAPFYVCMPLYVGAFLLAVVSWLGWSRPLNRASFWLVVLALGVHTFGLAARMYLQGRPPVTNLYSSAIYIGWMGVLLGLALEVIFGIGLGNSLAGAMGFMGVLIAHNLAGGDTLEMMRAVLDTNFWLATHVVCVSTGYAATLLAGFLGMFYILAGVFTRTDERGWGSGLASAAVTVAGSLIGVVAVVVSRRKAFKAVALMLYGILCFATLFSFVGTVLGGIWADQSWGRFWGWDPKENGALLIVVMNALILHARWSGLVKDRGMAVLAVCGNLVVGWSWFGTNQLGVGLHSYGFNSGLSVTLVSFWASQALVIALGLLPTRYWRGTADIKASEVAASRGDLGVSPA